jgi:uncharacterized protein with PIN domain
MTEPARKVEHPSDEDAAWALEHVTHRVTESDDCWQCHTCGITYWRRRKP